MNRVVALWLALVFGVLCVAACQKRDRPEDPVWGKQPCDHCKMILSEPRHAAQAIAPQGDRLFFDDLGCMLEHERARKTPPEHAWVRDDQGAWIDARATRYAKGARTPMDYGFASSASGTLKLEDVKREILQRVGAR
jgi:copper chaperone NosL